MSTDISDLTEVAGFIGACLVDSESGLMLASEQSNIKFDLEAAGAANNEVVRAKNEAIKALGPVSLYTSPSPRDLSTSRMPSSA